eukprot:GHVN01061360.1.p1 GENE.GHVN01061360.1~~GHVN01061360.1.p1  ORF type:complete len:1429 (-),score=298.29 GHVN01061360.1:269-4216(-)
MRRDPLAVSTLSNLFQTVTVQERRKRLNYCNLATVQRSMVPGELQRSETVSEILLESSLVGQYIMLPWNKDTDEDIQNNFWVDYPPPYCTPGDSRTTYAQERPYTQSAAVHSSHLDTVALPQPTSLTASTSLVNASANGQRYPSRPSFVCGQRGEVGDGAGRGRCVNGNCDHRGCVSALCVEEGAVGVDEQYHDYPHFQALNNPLDFSSNSLQSVSASGWDATMWTDPDGAIALSGKQQAKFHQWKRISEIVKDKAVVFADAPTAKSIRQGFVGDCSFLCSLAVLAELESSAPPGCDRRHRVLSGIIFPQNKDGVPRINERGMYACRLYFNGVERKVVVDDYVPVRKDGRLLAAHSPNRNEVWVTLLEKAFVKLMGGSYFMQGSNPGADLYHLTGWIPETIPFRSDIHAGSPETHQPIVTGGDDLLSGSIVDDERWKDVWSVLHEGLTSHRCVACLGTSEVADAAPSGLDYPEGVSVASGIVARHAYSILQYREVFGHRLLYVKNPWGCIRWKGKFGPGDTESWTPYMRKELDYNRKHAAANDNGCFWIEWSDVIRWFSHLYICWDRSFFDYHREIHSKWDRSRFIERSVLSDDSHLVAFNPQFHLRIPRQPPGVLVKVWVVLSRHVRERKRDLSQKYLAVHVHKGQGRVACPPPPVKQGVYSNAECTLVKLEIDTNKNPDDAPLGQPVGMAGALDGYGEGGNPPLAGQNFALVVSQYSQKDEFNFTLRVYSHVPVSVSPLPSLFSSDWRSTYYKGNWQPSTAGGCSNSLWSYFTNPQARLTLNYTCELILFLECPQENSVNLRIFKGRVATARLLRTGRAISSGPYHSGCCMIRQVLERGEYSLIMSTFRAAEVGDFQLVVHSSPPHLTQDTIQAPSPQVQQPGDLTMPPPPTSLVLPSQGIAHSDSVGVGISSATHLTGIDERYPDALHLLEPQITALPYPYAYPTDTKLHSVSFNSSTYRYPPPPQRGSSFSSQHGSSSPRNASGTNHGANNSSSGYGQRRTGRHPSSNGTGSESNVGDFYGRVRLSVSQTTILACRLEVISLTPSSEVNPNMALYRHPSQTLAPAQTQGGDSGSPRSGKGRLTAPTSLQNAQPGKSMAVSLRPTPLSSHSSSGSNGRLGSNVGSNGLFGLSWGGDGGASSVIDLVLERKCDLLGGLSEDGRTFSSAANDLLSRQGVVALSYARLEPGVIYELFIDTSKINKGKTSSHTNKDDNQTSQSNQQGRLTVDDGGQRPVGTMSMASMMTHATSASGTGIGSTNGLDKHDQPHSPSNTAQASIGGTGVTGYARGAFRLHLISDYPLQSALKVGEWAK